jgi:hypothetical protein
LWRKLKRLLSEIDLALGMHIKADPCPIGSFINVKKFVLLEYTVFVKFNEATITYFPTFRAL